MKGSSYLSDSPVYARLHERIVAFLVDLAIIYGTTLFFSLGFGAINDRGWVMFLSALFSWFYLASFYWKGKGQTLGCKVVGIKVTSVDGSTLTFWQTLLRSLSISALIAPLGFVSIISVSFILFSIISLSLKPTKEKRQTFWDAGTKTCVIKGGIKLKWNRW